MWERRGARSPRPGTGCRSSTSATSRRSAARTTRSGRRAASHELDYELEVAAVVDTPATTSRRNVPRRRSAGYTIFNDWSARDLQRDETAVRLGPAKGKDFASSFGPWLVTPDELADARSGAGYDLAMTRRGQRHRDEPRPLVRRAVLVRRDARPRLGRCPPAAGRPGRQRDGRRRAACSRSATRPLGRYLEPGDEVVARASSDWGASVTRSSRDGA